MWWCVVGSVAQCAVRIALSALRTAAHVVILVEAQRLLMRLLKPATHHALERAEHKLLAHVHSKIEHLWVPIEGFKLHTIIVGDRSDPPLVLLHGHSMSAAFYYRNFDDYVDMGYCVYAVDLLGWARSSHPEFEGSTSEDSLHYFLPSLRQWRMELALEKFALVGHSLGGYLAYEFAAENPEAVTQLTLICPAAIERRVTLYRGIYFSLTPQRFARRLGAFAWLMFLCKFPKSEVYNRHNVREYAWLLSAQAGLGSGDFAVGNMIQWRSPWSPEVRRPLLEHLRPLSMPVLLVSGLHDGLVPNEHVAEFCTALQQAGTQCEMYALPTDHCPHFEEPSTFAHIVRSTFGHPHRASTSRSFLSAPDQPQKTV
mmetsp:Transcript_5963/g.12596  ORF Transcript_5963/g.12596 Transcript_5963/m.12596 type:complete len:370 (-) Transcript_5963:101-1210(-)|eukprot:CAMPEP_0185846524 /NCGR_PEP_ID=MMETSP1354-20130828/2125_1 /TAXON_ID=708628 /ORGANISM="Erythrolobus madagascarensis, Strain CCMP3276" /LENGTH=369 /DNA_ID=CAMNT_0028546663 /DNA_START=126 /DNA_END=1235 /DNA_ORIENTATION=+